MSETRSVRPGPGERPLDPSTGAELTPPKGWAFLPAGDATLTRRVKAGGEWWAVEEQRGRKTFTRGIWAPAERIARQQARLVAERATPAYAARLQASRERRRRAEDDYALDFALAVREFLAFAPRYRALADALAEAVTRHAVPVGSGTVARTQRIPLERRAEAAMIAWLRHQTTAYDRMEIPRVKGRRREVRRMLARRSRELLGRFRRGEEVDPAVCPLQQALVRLEAARERRAAERVTRAEERAELERALAGPEREPAKEPAGGEAPSEARSLDEAELGEPEEPEEPEVPEEPEEPEVPERPRTRARTTRPAPGERRSWQRGLRRRGESGA